MPRPRSTPDRAPPRTERRANPFDRAAPEAIASRRAARDPDLTAMDVRLMVWLEEWAELHPGAYPARGRAAAELHVSPDTVRRCERRLESRGYLSRRLVSPRGRPPGLMDCDLIPPRPGLARPPADAVQGELFAGQICRDIAATAPGFPGKSAGQIGPLPPPDPPVLEQGSKDTTDVRASCFDLSIVEELSRRAYREIPGATPGKIAEALSSVGPEEFAAILDSAEKRNRSRDKASVGGWGYVVNAVGRILAKHAAAGRIAVPDRQAVPADEPAPAPSSTPAPPPAVNHNPGEKVEPVPPEERDMVRHWRQMIPRDEPAQKTPAAGSHANDPPPPGRELPDVPAAVSYRETVFTTRVSDSEPIAHPSPRGSDPDPRPTRGDAAIQTRAAGRRGGGRVASGARGAAASEARSPAPRGGAQPGPARGARAAGSPGPGLPRPSDPESDGAGPGRQRLSGPRPAFHPRE